jgi:hypothetical protein
MRCVRNHFIVEVDVMRSLVRRNFDKFVFLVIMMTVFS